ncbi:hypothetical protein GGR53DRAFT_448034 [Hypoxylon sp. FL1150]|nr:hypothetical protein GGR53DRAFT_448034 [Hypoxylon sp. FL1150]
MFTITLKTSVLATATTLLLLAVPAAAKTDLSGCVSSETVAYGGASLIWYVPGSGEICAFLDCGGGMAPPKTTVPGCAAYSGTATYSPSYLPGYGAEATSAAASSTENSSPAETSASVASSTTAAGTGAGTTSAALSSTGTITAAPSSSSTTTLKTSTTAAGSSSGGSSSSSAGNSTGAGSSSSTSGTSSVSQAAAMPTAVVKGAVGMVVGLAAGVAML